METWEAADYRNTYARTMELAAFNQLFPEHASFALPPLETGNRSAGSSQMVPGYIPPVILKAVAWMESGWAQASYNPFVPYGEVGPTLISHDCGYGLMQVTSGMQNITGVPNLDQAMIGGHYAFNIARGARILADKWNQGPEFRPIMADRNPHVLEHWYYALWAYNGFAFKNHPLNPAYDPNRLPYSCGPADDGLGHNRGGYPYEELVLGCVAHPPVRGGVQLWAPVSVDLPNRGDPAFAGPLSLSNWEPCALSLACAPMDLPTPGPGHQDGTTPALAREQVLGVPVVATSTGSVKLVSSPGGQSVNVSLAIGNPGSGVLAFRITSSAAWLRVSENQGVALGADVGFRNHTLTVRADATSLLPGTYTGQVVIESLYSTAPRAVITVTVENGDGTVVVTPDSRVHVLLQGVRRFIPDPATFEANGFSWSKIIPVPAEWLNLVPAGHPLTSVLAEGRLLRPAADYSPIYVMQGGVRRYVTSPAVLSQCGWGLDAIAWVPGPTVSAIPEGAAITGGACPRISLPAGTLLQESNGRISVIFGGLRRWIAGPWAFLDCGYKWGNRDIIGDSYVFQFAPGPDVETCSTDGSLLAGQDGTARVMMGGVTRHIPDPATFEALGYDWTRLTPVEIGAWPTGDKLLSVIGTGRLIAAVGEGAPVYVMDLGAKRHILTPDAFALCGYRWDALVRLPQTTVDAMPSGPPIAGVPCTELLVPPGTLLQASDGPVWVSIGQVRKWVLSPAAFASCGYRVGNVNRVPFGILAQLAVGETITTCTDDRSLLGTADGKLYMTWGGWKRLVPNPATLEAFGLSPSKLVPIPNGWLTTGHPLLNVLATGRLIRAPGTGVPVYVMEAGTKRHVSSSPAFSACGYSGDAIMVLSPGTVTAIPDGAPVSGPPCPKASFSDGTLLVGSDGKVWVMQGGQRRWVIDPSTFLGCGYSAANLNWVFDGIITALPQGATLTGNPCP